MQCRAPISRHGRRWQHRLPCNGRNAISWTKKFELDVWYVDHCSLWLDIKIIFITLKKVFVREGISSETSATMEAFTGNN